MINPSSCRLLALFVLVVFGAGCATQQQGRDVHRFDPLPRVDVGAVDLDPLETKRVTDLLLDAERAFKAANTAQESGDYAGATRHYTRMLEMLIAAEVDPAVFYNLRREFAHILDTTTLQASVYDHGQPRRWTEEDFQRHAVVGDLEIPDPIPQAVLDQIVRIQNGYPNQFQRGLNRSVRYLPYIHHEFAKAGIPRDLAWLAIVESNFWSDATSRAGAGGMWQFMRATGQQYNLQATTDLDERYNWEMATRAAARHLNDLYDTFGTWPLAITAYNSGTYNVQRRMALNGNDTDVFRLMSTPPASNAFPQETKEYYPKLLASIIVASDPEKYGFTISPELPDPYQRIPVRGAYTLAALNSELGLPAGTLEALNPELRQKRTPGRGDYAIAVPVGKGEELVAALEKLKDTAPAAPSEPRAVVASNAGGSRAVTHTVRRGETISGIAARYRVTQHAIMSNNRISSPERIRVGQRLTIPVSGDSAASVQVAASSSASSSSGGARSAPYTVRKGDSLSGIAQRHGVTTRQIQRWNDMGNSTRILVGQSLKVAPEATAPTAGAQVAVAPSGGGGSVTHVVKRGESPSGIAQQYGVSTSDLLAWNNLRANSTIRVDQKLVIRNAGSGGGSAGGSVRLASNAAPQSAVHKVASGENPWTIASRYGVSVNDFLKWNNLSQNSVLRVGQECVVYPGQGSGGSSSPSKITHTVKRGENPTTIAQRHGVSLSDLFTWNSWQRAPVLRVGDTITVYR